MNLSMLLNSPTHWIGKKNHYSGGRSQDAVKTFLTSKPTQSHQMDYQLIASNTTLQLFPLLLQYPSLSSSPDIFAEGQCVYSMAVFLPLLNI